MVVEDKYQYTNCKYCHNRPDIGNIFLKSQQKLTFKFLLLIGPIYKFDQSEHTSTLPKKIAGRKRPALVDSSHKDRQGGKGTQPSPIQPKKTNPDF